ncbi:hypothetical protein PIB30_101573 [Stylosanthes scabra]|uniref:Uncharacterized protein n=1 Tax=Stylosanthes scabra TaxID=79078 RepID=A0ABU6RXZ7_9FABA|nr:hypothetical protein [Stylosanthes scabra]
MASFAIEELQNSVAELPCIYRQQNEHLAPGPGEMACCTPIRYWHRRGGEQLFQPHFSPGAGEMVPGIAKGHVTLGGDEMEKKSISLMGTESWWVRKFGIKTSHAHFGN